MSTTGKPRLLDHVREVLRLHPDSIHTERAYCAQIRRYANYHTITHREDRKDGARKIEAFLTHLAMAGTVSPSNQNQAMNALVFVRNDSSLPQKVRELARLTTARAKDCPYIMMGGTASRTHSCSGRGRRVVFVTLCCLPQIASPL